MKKILFLMLIVALAVSMVFAGVACKGGTAAAADEEAAAAEPKEIVYVTVLLNVYYGWNIAHQGAIDRAAEYGYNIDVVGPNEIDTAMQLDLMDTAIGQGVDAIIAVPLVPDSYHDVYSKANDAGIIIGEAAVTAGSDLPNIVTSGYSDNTLWGVQVADVIAEKTGGEANILVACTALDTPNQLESRQSFEKYAGEEHPGLKIIEVIETNSDHNTGLEKIKNAIIANPEIDFIWANEGFVAQSAATALDELGKQGEITILAVDAAKETTDLIIAGEVWATFDQAFYEAWGTSIVDQFKNHWDGKPVEKSMFVPFVYYDKENLDSHPAYEERYGG